MFALYICLTFCCRQFCWIDEKGKKSKESAAQYIDYVTTYIQKTISDESMFPTKFGTYVMILTLILPPVRLVEDLV